MERLEDRLALTVLTVSSLADGPVNLTDGVVTLRDALQAANNDLQISPGGATGSGADEIRFQAGLVGTITLNQGELAITSDLTITGPGANLLTISGNNASRVFDVSDGAASVKTVVLSGLTIAAGNTLGSGGGISNRENLTIVSSALRDNFSGGSGGGVVNFPGATLTVLSSIFSGNTAASSGGAIRNTNAVVTVQNSTLSGNVANASGGGIDSFGTSGAPSTLILQSSTMTQNRADADNNATGVSGGISSTFSTFSLHNTIVADNFVGSGSTEDNLFVTGFPINAVSSNNLIGAGLAGGLTNGVNGNQVGVADPGLVPLANNGGPTLTHALLASSPAINAGDLNFVTPPSFDQRGASFVRVAGGRVDIGAFEVQGAIAPSANFDGDADVDGADFLSWQRGFGIMGAAKSDGDADNDTDVDVIDLGIWRSQFGQPAPLASVSASSSEPLLATVALVEQPLDATLIDAAMALEWIEGNTETADGSVVVEEDLSLLVAPRLSDNSSDSNIDTSISTSAASSRATVDEADVTEETWLSEELLESVFG